MSVYLQAARYIDKQKPLRGACEVIAQFDSGSARLWAESAKAKEFAKLFKPRGTYRILWFGDCWKDECREHRVMALLLMHEIAKDRK